MNIDNRYLAVAAAVITGLAIFTLGFWPTVVILFLAAAAWLLTSYFTGRLPIVDKYLGDFFDRRRNRD